MATELTLNKLQKIVCADPDGYVLPATDGFTLQPIRPEEELKNMEQKLTDKQHAKNCLAWLQNEVMATDPTKRYLAHQRTAGVVLQFTLIQIFHVGRLGYGCFAAHGNADTANA
uniref:Uncharacterized protein n=1 Tax=Anopheles merus TaxID=30066 RepID=A0A182UVK0_ANOME